MSTLIYTARGLNDKGQTARANGQMARGFCCRVRVDFMIVMWVCSAQDSIIRRVEGMVRECFSFQLLSALG